MPKSNNIIELIDECISKKNTLDARIAWDFANISSKWKPLYDKYEKEKRKVEFLAVSPYFFATAYQIPFIDLMLRRPFRADAHKATNAENYQKILIDFWENFAEENFAPYKEIQQILKAATPHELFTLIRKCQTILELIIPQYHFSKLLEGNFTIAEKPDYIDPYLLLRLVLQQKKLNREQKLYAIRLLQDLVDVTSISYYKSVTSSSPSTDIAEECFNGSQSTQETWIKDKRGEYFSLVIPSDKLDAFMDKLKNSFDNIDPILLKTVIININTVQSASLLSYSAEFLNGAVSSHVRQYVKQLIKTIGNNIDLQLKRDLENCLLNPALRQLFSFTGQELYTLMRVPMLNPICHKVIVDNQTTKSALIAYAIEKNLLEELCGMSPYLYVVQYCPENTPVEKKLEHIARILLTETDQIQPVSASIHMHNDFLTLFKSQHLSLLFAKDKMLRDIMLEKFTVEKFAEYEKYQILMFFVAENKKLLETESDSKKIIDICLKLTNYRQQGCNLIEDVDKYLTHMIDTYTDLVAANAANDKRVRNIIFSLASLPQQKLLMEGYPYVFGSLKTSSYNKALTFNFNTNQQNDIKSNVSNLVVTGLSVELLDKIKTNIEPQNISEVQNLLQEFMDDDIAPGTNIVARLEALTEFLKLDDSRDIAEILLQIEAEKKSHDQSKLKILSNNF